DELGGVMDGPGVVGREIVDEGEAAEETWASQRPFPFRRINHRLCKQRLCLLLNLLKAILPPGKQIRSNAKARQRQPAVGCGPEKSWLAQGLLQENGRIHPWCGDRDREETAV